MKRRQLLDNISMEALEKMVPCFRPVVRRYKKDEEILTYSGEEDKQRIAVLRQGRARLEVLDIEGNMFRLESFESGDVFGELFTLPINSNEYIVTAEENCHVIYLDYTHVITPCEHICPFHTQLISNLFIMTAQKTQELSFHLSVLHQHSIREKLLCYLRYVRVASEAQVGDTFELPMTLSKLADYLCVDRSAMMREMKSMKNDGILSSNQRTFCLYA